MSKDLAGFLATCVAQYLDKNLNGMTLSSMECEELEKAFLEDKFARIELWVKYKLIKHGNKNKE